MEEIYGVQSTDGVVYFATDRGVYMARENGRTWTRYQILNNGSPVPFYSIAVAPGKVYAGANGGLAVSSDKGATWKVVVEQPAHRDPGSLRAGRTALRGIDGGVRFPRRRGTLHVPRHLAADQSIETLTCGAGTLWAITVDEKNNRALFESADAGATWKSRTNMALKSGGTEFSVDPMDFVASGDALSLSAGTYLDYSLDAGSTWKQKSASEHARPSPTASRRTAISCSPTG